MKLTAILLSGALFVAAASGTKKNSLEKANLKGKVRLVTDITYSTAKADSGRMLSKTVLGYSTDGQLVTDEYYEGSNMLYNREYRYNSNGNIIEAKRHNGKQTIHYTRKYKYDGAGNMTEEKDYREDSLQTRYTYKYDSKGMQIESEEFKGNNRISEWWEYKYDANSNMTERSKHEHTGKVSQTDTFVYDANGCLTETSSQGFNEEAQLKTKYTYSYDNLDKMGNWQKMVTNKDDAPQIVTMRTIEYYQ
jgi:hypothetical protein